MQTAHPTEQTTEMQHRTIPQTICLKCAFPSAAPLLTRFASRKAYLALTIYMTAAKAAKMPKGKIINTDRKIAIGISPPCAQINKSAMTVALNRPHKISNTPPTTKSRAILLPIFSPQNKLCERVGKGTHRRIFYARQRNTLAHDGRDRASKHHRAKTESRRPFDDLQKYSATRPRKACGENPFSYFFSPPFFIIRRNDTKIKRSLKIPQL